MRYTRKENALLEREKSPSARKKSWHVVAVNGEQMARLKDLAATNGSSVNETVRQILDQYFQTYSRKDGNAQLHNTGNP
jgi:hypothetical protein